MYKPFHLIGLELSISVPDARRCAASRPAARARWRGDAVAAAKRDLRAGEMLDGEGGYTVWGKLVPAARSRPSARCRSGWPTASGCGATWPRAPS